MRTWIKRVAVLFVVLLLSWLLISWFDWLPRIGAEQRAALERMRAPMQDAVGQRNAFDLFWLLPYRVPESERAEVLAQDYAALDALHPTRGTEPSLTSAAYPRHLERNAATLPCGREPGCLAEVRADPNKVRAQLTEAEPILAGLRQLGDYDHLRVPFGPSFQAPLPEFQHTGTLQLSEAALAFVDGDADAAFAGLCRDIAAWRKLKGRSDSLIFEMISLAWLQGAAQLYADMRAELPVDHPLPGSCGEAFGPPLPSERQSCDVYRSEFALNERVMGVGAFSEAEEPSVTERIRYRLLVNHEATAAVAARTLSGVCDALQQPVAEWSEPRSSGWTAHSEICGWSGWPFNIVGCTLVGISLPTYSDYGMRDRDVEGMLRLLQLADWLARQPDRETAFAQRPDAHRGFEQAVSFEGGELAIDLLRPRGESSDWRIPLPASRLQAAEQGSAVATSADSRGEVPAAERTWCIRSAACVRKGATTPFRRVQGKGQVPL